MTYKTFNGWRKAGYVVAAGEVGGHYNEYGDKLFHKSQVVPRGQQVTTYYDKLGRKVRRVTEFVI